MRTRLSLRLLALALVFAASCAGPGLEPPFGDSEGTRLADPVAPAAGGPATSGEVTGQGGSSDVGASPPQGSPPTVMAPADATDDKDRDSSFDDDAGVVDGGE